MARICLICNSKIEKYQKALCFSFVSSKYGIHICTHCLESREHIIIGQLTHKPQLQYCLKCGVTLKPVKEDHFCNSCLESYLKKRRGLC